MDNFTRKNSIESITELNRLFPRAANQTRIMMRQKLLTDLELSNLEGLFSQATCGDGNMWRFLRDPKFMVDGRVKSKADAWTSHRGKNPIEAKQEYVDTVEILTQKYNVVFPPSRASSVASVATCYTDVP